MQDNNLDALKQQMDKQRKAQMNKILKAIAPELEKVETDLAVLEGDLQTREKAIEFHKTLDALWDEMKSTPGNRIYDAHKALKDLESAMDGKVNAAIVVTKVPVASPLWSQLSTAKYQLRALRRAVGKEVAGLVQISVEEAQKYMDDEEKARAASKPSTSNTQNQASTNQEVK